MSPIWGDGLHAPQALGCFVCPNRGHRYNVSTWQQVSYPRCCERATVRPRLTVQQSRDVHNLKYVEAHPLGREREARWAVAQV